jgi:hypothetical protein
MKYFLAQGFSLDAAVDITKFHQIRPDAVLIGNFDNKTMMHDSPEVLARNAEGMLTHALKIELMEKLIPATGCEITALNEKTAIRQLQAFAEGVRPISSIEH